MRSDVMCMTHSRHPWLGPRPLPSMARTLSEDTVPSHPWLGPSSPPTYGMDPIHSHLWQGPHHLTPMVRTSVPSHPWRGPRPLPAQCSFSAPVPLFPAIPDYTPYLSFCSGNELRQLIKCFKLDAISVFVLYDRWLLLCAGIPCLADVNSPSSTTLGCPLLSFPTSRSSVGEERQEHLTALPAQGKGSG